MAKAWFKTKDPGEAHADAVVDVNDVNHISSGTVLKGDISSVNDIRVDGIVDGKVYTKGKVVVGEKAVITGAVVCQNADFWGKVDGDVYVQEYLTVKPSSSVSGSINAGHFQLEMGATLNCSCNMISKEDFDKFVDEVVKVKLQSLP